MQKNTVKWLNNNIKRDFLGKNVLITGATSGIGLSLAEELLSFGANLIMPVRNNAKGESVKSQLLGKYPNAVITLFAMDLSSLQSISQFVNELKSNKVDIDIVVNNAGVFGTNSSVTADGLEAVIGTNFLGVVYFNNLLMPYLSQLNHNVEVVVTTSVASNMAKINYDDFFSEKHCYRMRAYSNSKLALIHYFLHLKEVKPCNVKVYLTHPGATYTPLVANSYPKWFRPFAKAFMKTFFHTPESASLTVLFALEKQIDGGYFVPNGFIQFSGKPKQAKLPSKFCKNVDKTMEVANEVLSKALQNNTKCHY